MTIFEVLIAVAIGSVITILLVWLLVSWTRTSGKNLDTLAYLQDASLLMEYVKRDIRNASRDTPRETISGSNPRITTYMPDGQVRDVQYEYDAESRLVTRRGEDGKTTRFGRGRTGGQGHITDFKVTPVEGKGNETFFQILVGFASPERVRDEEAGKVDATKRPLHHRVQALVNRRTPSETDDKWKAAFR